MKNQKTRPRSCRSLILLAGVCAAMPAMAQPCRLSIDASDKVLTTGESAQINVRAHFPPSAYAFASTTMSVAADFPGWSFASAGAIVGASVVGINASQPHNPFVGVFADPANPLRIWTGIYTPLSYEPRFVQMQATPGPMNYYPSQLTVSTASCNADPGRMWLLVNPIAFGAGSAAPGEGSRIEPVGDSLVVEAEPTAPAILIGLLCPAVQKVRVAAGNPDDLVVETNWDADIVPTDQISMNYTKIEFEYKPSAHSSIADSFVYRLLRDGELVGEFPAPDGVAPFMLGRLPDIYAPRVDDGATPGESVLVSAWEYDAPTTVRLPDGRLLTANAMESRARCTNNLRQIGLAMHSFHARGTPQLVLTPLPTGNPCPADFNQDGGVDGADVEAFFAAWEQGLRSGDVNSDGGIDGTDVEVFFRHWEAGGC